MPFKQLELEKMTEKLRHPLNYREVQTTNHALGLTMGWRWNMVKEQYEPAKFWPDQERSYILPRFITDIRHAMQLLESLLPDWELSSSSRNGQALDVYVIGPNYKDDAPWAHSSRPMAGIPLSQAICFATIDGLISQTRTNPLGIPA